MDVGRDVADLILRVAAHFGVEVFLDAIGESATGEAVGDVFGGARSGDGGAGIAHDDRLTHELLDLAETVDLDRLILDRVGADVASGEQVGEHLAVHDPGGDVVDLVTELAKTLGGDGAGHRLLAAFRGIVHEHVVEVRAVQRAAGDNLALERCERGQLHDLGEVAGELRGDRAHWIGTCDDGAEIVRAEHLDAVAHGGDVLQHVDLVDVVGAAVNHAVSIAGKFLERREADVVASRQAHAIHDAVHHEVDVLRHLGLRHRLDDRRND